MVESPTVVVPEKRLELLEREHKYLELIREANSATAAAKIDYDCAKNEALEKKKVWDRKVAELSALIENGPPKPDPQSRLPFVEDGPAEQPFATAAASAQSAPIEEPGNAPIPADIAALDLTDKQKQSLANAGAKSLADVADIGNGNWPQYPKGLTDISGMGPKAVARLIEQLPSTAPKVEEKPGHAPSSTVLVELLTMSAASPNLEVGDHYSATLLDDNSIVIQLPGEEPVSFSPGEYRVVEQSAS